MICLTLQKDDVELICSNCTLYNAVNTVFYKAAVELLSYGIQFNNDLIFHWKFNENSVKFNNTHLARELITKNMNRVHPVEVGPISIHSEDKKSAEPTNILQHSPPTTPTQRNSVDKNGMNTRRSLKLKDSVKNSLKSSLKSSPSCIGKRVSVYWDEYDKKYPGTIVQFNRRRPAPYQVLIILVIHAFSSLSVSQFSKTVILDVHKGKIKLWKPKNLEIMRTQLFWNLWKSKIF